MRRLLACLLAGLAGLVTLSPAVAATAAPSGPADGCTGVWVVVDATALGGGVRTSCAASHATGTESLQSAGFEVARSGGMLCQLDGRPEACTISASAYWSYWQATPAGQGYGAWAYATLGPDSYHPRGGDAEGWVFGDGSQPPSETPATLAVAGTPASSPPASASFEATPPSSPASTGTADTDQGSGSPLVLIAVAAIAVVATGGVWLVRRRAR